MILHRISQAIRNQDWFAVVIEFAQGYGGAIWVACFASSETIGMDPGSGKVLQRSALAAGPLNLVAHPQLTMLYACLPRRNEVVEISLIAEGVTRRFPAGIEPDGLAFVR